MYITPWKEEEDKSFFGCVASIKEGLSPIFKLRVVKKCDGNYMVVIRDYKTKQLITEHSKGLNQGWKLEVAQCKVIEYAQFLLMCEGSNECVILNKFVCPHKEISGKHCSTCKIPDFFLN